MSAIPPPLPPLPPPVAQPPPLPPDMTPRGPFSLNLYRIAYFQRMVMLSLLSVFPVVILGLTVHVTFFFLLLGCYAFQLYAFNGLIKEINWPHYLVLIGLLAPFLNLIFLLVSSQAASSYLTQAGFKVGFLGVSPKYIREAKERGFI